MDINAEAMQQLAQAVTVIQQQLQQVHLNQQQLQNQIQQERKQGENNSASETNINYPINARQPTNHIVKPSKPETFSGDQRSKADIWLFELENYFNATDVLLDSQRISFAVSQLREGAVAWWKHYLDSLNENEVPVNTWSGFKQLFLTNYKPIEASETARVALYALKQTGTVSDYTDAFLRHLNYVDKMANEDKIFLFKKGLSYSLAKEIGMHHPATLMDAINLAQRAELEQKILRVQHPHQNASNSNANHRNNNNRSFRNNISNNYKFNNFSGRPRGYSTFNSSNRSYSTAYNQSSNQSAVPMELGQMEEQESDSPDNMGNDNRNMDQLNALNTNRTFNGNTGRTFIPGVSREEFQRCVRAGLCLACKQSGHIARNCPNRSTQSKKE